ncbi:MAG: adenosylcobinamide-GDP ribazoletransferase [Oscillospiraceae bacterium]|nr:adenosylcobinamide-GDP ribazoletransferase [Oscillospiraceae bacterium]
MLKSLISAFLMYSRIPMPQVEWKEENRRYALGWFPLIGAVIGGLLLLWRMFCTRFQCGQMLFAAVAVLLPVLITGGIHLDGFCDVTDARASYADKEKRLKIMSDPHIGSFAVIRVCLYLILQTALFTQISDIRNTTVIACGYVLSRAFSGLSAVTFRCAKKNGTLQDFVKPSHRSVTVGMVSVFAAAAFAVMIYAGYAQGCAALGSAVLCFLYYRYIAYKDFGGTTGDLCGWFLQLSEIAMLAAAVLTGILTEGLT